MSNSKMQDLLLKNKTQKNDLDWIARFSQRCNLTLAPLDWDRREQLTNTLKPAFTSLILIAEENQENSSAVIQNMKDLLEQSPERELVLFPKFGADPSAFMVERQTLLREFSCVVKMLDFDVCLSTTDGGSGVVLESNYSNRLGVYSKDGFRLVSGWGTFVSNKTKPL